MKVKNGELMACRGAVEELIKVRLPVRTSLQVAKFANRLNEKLKPIDTVRQNLIKENGQKAEKGSNFEVIGPNDAAGRAESPGWGKFAKEYNELMEIEDEFAFEKIKIFEKVAGTCDSCHHNMDVVLQIEPAVLIPLERFIEVV